MNINSRSSYLVQLGQKQFEEHNRNVEVEECICNSNLNCHEAEIVDDPYQSSGSEYVPEETDSAEEIGSGDEYTALEEFNVNVIIGVQEDKSKGRIKRGRKRKIPDQSRANRKKFANTNKKYVSSRNVLRQPKNFNEAYSCKCTKKCTSVVDINMRRKLFNQFWTIGTFEGRCALISKYVKQIKKKRCYTKSKKSRRENSRLYFIDDQQVCKEAFLKTLQINSNRINICLNKMQLNIIQDERGRKSGGKNAIDDQRIQEIMDHINSFPKYVSHYCRNQTDSKFLRPDLNLAKMYSLYREKISNNVVSISKYKQVFYANFNLRFKTPHKDTCCACDVYNAQISSAESEAKQELEENHNKHLKIAEELRNQMKDDLKAAENDETLETLTFDLQKTHPIPRIPTGIVYYKRQLNLFNLGIHVGSTRKGVFNVWLKHEAGRRTQEVGLCLRKYINDNIVPPVNKLILWSDSCGGQNRSVKLVLMLINILQNHISLTSISIRFLLSGHSFLPNDSEFGDVECALKVQQRLYTDKDYIEIMKSCRTKKKFIVNRIQSVDMVAVQNMEHSITNRKTDINKEKISWLKTHEITIRREVPTTLFMKNHITDPEYLNVNIEKAGKGRKPMLKVITLPPLWPTGRVLSNEKIKDLKDILKLIPKDAQPFFKFLKNIVREDFEDDVDGIGPDPDFNIEEDGQEHL